MTTADILPFERGVRMFRGVEAERDRKARIRERWVEARRRAFNCLVTESDVALFGLEALAAERGPVFLAQGSALQVLKHG